MRGAHTVGLDAEIPSGADEGGCCSSLGVSSVFLSRSTGMNFQKSTVRQSWSTSAGLNRREEISTCVVVRTLAQLFARATYVHVLRVLFASNTITCLRPRLRAIFNFQ